MLAALNRGAALANHAARPDGFAFDNPLHDAAFARDRLGHGAFGRALLDIFHRSRLYRLGRFDLHACCRGFFRDMDRTTREQRTARCSCGQFRQGHLYRHEQALSLLLQGPVPAATNPPADTSLSLQQTATPLVRQPG